VLNKSLALPAGSARVCPVEVILPLRHPVNARILLANPS